MTPRIQVCFRKLVPVRPDVEMEVGTLVADGVLDEAGRCCSVFVLLVYCVLGGKTGPRGRLK